MLEQVKASAGSGKTFELTKRFLTLLSKSLEQTPSNACGLGSAQGYTWPEIMAVTFTNKAAAEMKERVVSALKSRALGLEGGPAKDWTPENANARLENILLRFDQLNIRTIDSLLHLLMRVFALEIGPAPDFEAVFQVGEVFEPLYDR
ncbi:MAG: UvrD-helicase domain-containing protein, partial [Thermodesulfobacteriota bacterium]|nr:UvrD-helicase domain-containing protein [Thermodesulfobacteriota bacterium]